MEKKCNNQYRPKYILYIGIYCASLTSCMLMPAFFHYDCVSSENLTIYRSSHSSFSTTRRHTQTCIYSRTYASKFSDYSDIKQTNTLTETALARTHAISGITIISFQKQLIRVMILKRL